MSDNFDIDPDLVRRLADLLNETGLAEIEYEDNGKRVRVAMPDAGAVTAAVAAPPVAAPAAVAAPAPGGGDFAAHPGAVTAPMVAISSELGPMKAISCSSTIRAKFAFSERKPYPGWIASASVTVAAERMAGMLR